MLAATKQQPEKKPNTAPQKPRVRPPRGRRGRRPVPAKSVQNAEIAKAPKAAKGKERGGAREGSKTAKVLELVKRPEGATLKEIIKSTGWQPHSIRGFISGTLGKKMRLVAVSTKGEDGERVYSVPKQHRSPQARPAPAAAGLSALWVIMSGSGTTRPARPRSSQRGPTGAQRRLPQIALAFLPGPLGFGCGGLLSMDAQDSP